MTEKPYIVPTLVTGVNFLAITQTYIMQKVVIDKDISVVDPVSIIEPIRAVVVL